MEEFSRNQSAKFEFYEGGIKNPISQMEYDHDQTENVMFEKFRSITKNYQLSQNTDNAFKALYDNLKNIEATIGEHIILENEILFPRAIELELQLIHKR